MKITLRKPIGYSQIGRKDQQEDAVWPLFSEVTSENHCIVLCDGVGGSEYGEVASQTSSKVIGEYLTKLIKEKGIVTEADIQDAVSLAYDKLEEIDIDTASSGKISMATTLTCVCMHKDGIIAAHMGDSRIYHIRPGQGLLYQSADHSLVNALLQAGELTLEEAKNFRRKNVITKAIQPHAGKRFKAEVHQLVDIKSGDYLFLCCDGVLEQLTNDRLVEILSMKCSDKAKLQMLESESTNRTKDNYTAYLIPINQVVGVSSVVHEDDVEVVEAAVVDNKTIDVAVVNPSEKEKSAPIKTVKTSGKRSAIPRFIPLVLFVLVIGVGAFLFGHFWGKNGKTKDSTDLKESVENVLLKQSNNVPIKNNKKDIIRDKGNKENKEALPVKQNEVQTKVESKPSERETKPNDISSQKKDEKQDVSSAEKTTFSLSVEEKI